MASSSRKAIRARSTRHVSESDSDSDTGAERKYYGRSSSGDSEEDDDDLLPRVKDLKLADRENRGAGGGGGSRRTPEPLPVVTNITQLGPLGQLRKLTPVEATYSVIVKYAMNSAGANWNLKVMNVFEIASGNPAALPPPLAPAQIAAPQPANPFQAFALNPALRMRAPAPPVKKVQLDLLLWCKTAPNTAQFLMGRGNAWAAFYDRIERAFPVTPDDWGKGSIHQIILLCSVSMGKPFKSEEGYHHWRNQQVPQGFDSVLARGRLQPDWEETREVNSVLVPCGKTRKEKGRRKLPLSHTEYLVTRQKVKPFYAVEVQITPKRCHR